MSVVFKYLYRDAGNYKLLDEIILANRSGIDVHSAEKTIRSSLISGEFFIAEEIKVQPLRFEKRDPDLDHGWHEFYSIMEADDLVGEEPARDLSDFLQDLQRASVEWKKFC